MAVEAVGHVFAVGHIFDNAVLFPKLRHLQPAQALRRRAVNRIQLAVRLFELVDFLVDMLHNLECELPVLCNRFFIIKLLQFVERRYAKRRRRGVEQGLDLVVNAEVSAVEPALTVCQRIGRGAHLA